MEKGLNNKSSQGKRDIFGMFLLHVGCMCVHVSVYDECVVAGILAGTG